MADHAVGERGPSLIESRVTRVEEQVQAVNESIHSLTRSFDRLREDLSRNSRPNYGVMIALGALLLALGGVISRSLTEPISSKMDGLVQRDNYESARIDRIQLRMDQAQARDYEDLRFFRQELMKRTLGAKGGP